MGLFKCGLKIHLLCKYCSTTKPIYFPGLAFNYNCHSELLHQPVCYNTD